MGAVPFHSEGEYLGAVLRLVDGYLCLLENPEEKPRDLVREELHLRSRCQATLDHGGAMGLEYLFRIFGLTDFERHCVYLALAPELDGSYEGRYAALQPDRCRLPSLELCLRSYCANLDRRAELLAQWLGREEVLDRFFQNGHRGIKTQSDLTPGLKLERRILGFVQDVTRLDPELEEIATLHWPGEELPELVIRRETLERMIRYSGKRLEQKAAFWLWGDRGSGRRTLARHLCSRENRPLLLVDVEELARDEEHWDERLARVCRETVIFQAALAFVGVEALTQVPESPGGREQPPIDTEELADQTQRKKRWMKTILAESARVTDRLFLLGTVARAPETVPGPWNLVEAALPVPGAREREQLWTRALAGVPLGMVRLERLAGKFALQPGQIAAAARQARQMMDWEGKEALEEELVHRSCRGQMSHRLGKMASKVNTQYTWEDLILPQEQKRRLENACAQVEYRHRVYEQWGFGKKTAYGRGISMLFTGPPGTGKTMAAQVIANRLGLELYKVDLAGVVSKYIGETEKQLGAVFEEVRKSQSILFFDEADALFGKRSETRDSQDRYANIQTSFLLQKMEEYEGIVILTSNFRQNFDEAFTRRLKFIIEFALPEQPQREQIWRSVIPRELPLEEELDYEFLARSFPLSGSSIKNIATGAAFLAAAEGAPMGMVHLLLAVQEEQNKAGKSMGREEFGEYYHQVQRYLQRNKGME